MSKVFVRSLAVIISSAGFLVVQTTGAQAASDVVPESVSVWFEQEAASVVRDVLHDGAFGVEGEGRTAGGEYAVGAPTRLFEWSDDLGGEGNLPPVEATEVWVAPFIYGGQVRGTVAAELIGRDVIFAYLDDDVTGGLALMNSPGEQVVQDPRLGGLLSLDESGAAQGTPPRSGPTIWEVMPPWRAVPVTSLQRHREARWALRAQSPEGCSWS